MTDEKRFSEVVVRGERPISSKAELDSALAMAVRLENVGVLLGAGASVGAGGLAMGQLWSRLQKDHASIVSFLTKAGFRAADEQNLEIIISRIELALQECERRKEDAAELKEAHGILRHAVVCAATLNPSIWADPSIAPSFEKLAHHRRLLTRLLASRQPGQPAPAVFTTNYDLAVEWSAEALGIHVVNGFSGLHGRTFQPSVFDLSLRNTAAQGEARFGAFDISLVKLHGSMSWVEQQGQVFERPAGQVAERLAKYLADKKEPFNPLLIYPSTAKYVDTIGFVYGEMMRRFSEFMARQHSCLITCGYGFNDAHVNRLVAAGLQNPTLMLIAYYPEWDDCSKPVPNAFLERLRALGSPRVIIRGGGSAAYLDRLVDDLPDPTLIDEAAAVMRRLASLLREPKDAAPK